MYSYEYAIIRFVPRVERQEFVNVGVVLSCKAQGLLQARYELDPLRLQAFAPNVELEFVEDHLQHLVAVCEGQGPIGRLPFRERFHWLTAPRSTILQLSPLHAGLCQDLQATLEHLLTRFVRPENPPPAVTHSATGPPAGQL